MTLTLKLNEAVTVSGGTPTLTLNDGGVATYSSGSGTNALTFTYTVGASNTNVAALAASSVNLNGATIVNGVGRGRQSVADRHFAERSADRHHDADPDEHRRFASERRPGSRQDR